MPAGCANLGILPLAIQSTVGTGIRNAGVIDRVPGDSAIMCLCHRIKAFGQLNGNSQLFLWRIGGWFYTKPWQQLRSLRFVQMNLVLDPCFVYIQLCWRS